MGLESFNETMALVLGVQLANGDGTTPKALLTATTAPQRIDHVILSSTSAADHDVALYYHISTTNYLVGVVKVPAGAGTSTIPPVDAIGGIPGTPGGLLLTFGASIYIACLVTLSGAEVISVAGFGGYL